MSFFGQWSKKRGSRVKLLHLFPSAVKLTMCGFRNLESFLLKLWDDVAREMNLREASTPHVSVNLKSFNIVRSLFSHSISKLGKGWASCGWLCFFCRKLCLRSVLVNSNYHHWLSPLFLFISFDPGFYTYKSPTKYIFIHRLLRSSQRTNNFL